VDVGPEVLGRGGVTVLSAADPEDAHVLGRVGVAARSAPETEDGLVLGRSLRRSRRTAAC